MSLHILTIESNMKDAPKKYCAKCLSTDIHVGHIFEWLQIQPKKIYKNLSEYEEYKRKIKYANYMDSIRQEIEEEINSLYQ